MRTSAASSSPLQLSRRSTKARELPLARLRHAPAAVAESIVAPPRRLPLLGSLDADQQIHPVEQRSAEPSLVASRDPAPSTCSGCRPPHSRTDRDWSRRPACTRVGNSSARWPRTIVTRPSSSGWRSASSVGRANSDSSSRRGRPDARGWPRRAWAGSPRRTSPADEIVWCGARNGRHSHEPSGVHPGDAVDSRYLQRLIPGQGRQDRRQPPCEHRLAGPWRALEHQVVRRPPP